MPRIVLAYGRTPYPVDVAEGATVVDLPPAPPPKPLRPLLDCALANPIGCAPLRGRVAAGARVVVVVSDATRDEPRAEMLAALLDHLAVPVELVIAVANGTHAPGDVARLGLDAQLVANATFVNHDGHAADGWADLGTTARGTRLRVHRCLVEADLVVATGRIKPHYFAGYGAGAKALFPGLGRAEDVRVNHRLKAEPGARAGIVDGNPCREDLEAIVDSLPRPPFLLNVVTDAAGRAQAAVAGDVRRAFRVGAERCAPLYTVRAPRARAVIVSDRLPLTATLYQACKLVATGAPLVEEGGVLVLVAECAEGTGPIDVVNRAIYDLGIAPKMPKNSTISIVSSMSSEVVATTFGRFAPSVAAALADAGIAPAEPPVVLQRAGVMIVEPSARR
jgi:nickel-dependent lactate racemase